MSELEELASPTPWIEAPQARGETVEWVLSCERTCSRSSLLSFDCIVVRSICHTFSGLFVSFFRPHNWLVDVDLEHGTRTRTELSHVASPGLEGAIHAIGNLCSAVIRLHRRSSLPCSPSSVCFGDVCARSSLAESHPFVHLSTAALFVQWWRNAPTATTLQCVLCHPCLKSSDCPPRRHPPLPPPRCPSTPSCPESSPAPALAQKRPHRAYRP